MYEQEAAPVDTKRPFGAGLSISVDFMALMELSPLILRVATVFLRRPARCNLTEANLEGHFRNAYAVWTT
jgi:hypothetical protein